jgi:hypothetical protein
VGINHQAGIPAVEVVFTILHAGGKFGGGGYKVSGGLHGVGASVVNALSEWLEVRIFHEGKIYKQRYERGNTMYKLKVVGDCEPDKHGTEVTFMPDSEIFDTVEFDYDTLKQRFREMAFLTKGLRITFTDERGEKPRQKSFASATSTDTKYLGLKPSGAKYFSQYGSSLRPIWGLGYIYARRPARLRPLHSAAAQEAVSPSGFLCVTMRMSSWVSRRFAHSL